MTIKKAKDVDEYIKEAPPKAREKLEKIRGIIKATSPESEEIISYGMPYYGYHGRLAYFSITKQHIGLYIPPPVIQDFDKELKKYSTSKGTVRFPLNQNLPIILIKKLIKARMKINLSKN